MSTLDQAFVKAFARQQTPSPAGGDPPRAEANGPGPPATTDSRTAKGMLAVDPSVSGSAFVWIDEAETTGSRPDRPPASGVSLPPASGPAGAEALPGDLGQTDIGEMLGAVQSPGTGPAVAAPLYRFDPAHTGAEPAASDNPPAVPISPADGITPADPFDEPPAAEPLAEPTFRAVWEVDAFDMPGPVMEWFAAGVTAADLGRRMSEAVVQGLRSVLLTSVLPGEGRSSVAIGLAAAAAATGLRVALLDADPKAPTLADDLRLDVEYGWIDAVRGGLPVEEVAIHSLQDRLTFIPLLPPNGDTAATAAEVELVVDQLRERFDLVVIDGPTEAGVVVDHSLAIDTALIVRDVRQSSVPQVNRLSYRLRERGIQGVGVVENRCPGDVGVAAA